LRRPPHDPAVQVGTWLVLSVRFSERGHTRTMEEVDYSAKTHELEF